MISAKINILSFQDEDIEDIKNFCYLSLCIQFNREMNFE